MDSFYATCNQIDTDLGLNLYHDHHDYLVMPGVEGFEQTTFPVLLDNSPRAHNVKNHIAHPCYLIAGNFSVRITQRKQVCVHVHRVVI